MVAISKQRIFDFVLGWRRRSGMILDGAGCPRWLSGWRCKPPHELANRWGTILTILTLGLAPEFWNDKQGEDDRI